MTVGYDPSAPDRPIEVFYSEGFRSGSDMEFTVQDACVLISLLLQHGVPPSTIASSTATRESEDADLMAGDLVLPKDALPTHGSLAGTIAAELCNPAELGRRERLIRGSIGCAASSSGANRASRSHVKTRFAFTS